MRRQKKRERETWKETDRVLKSEEEDLKRSLPVTSCLPSTQEVNQCWIHLPLSVFRGQNNTRQKKNKSKEHKHNFHSCCHDKTFSPLPPPWVKKPKQQKSRTDPHEREEETWQILPASQNKEVTQKNYSVSMQFWGYVIKSLTILTSSDRRTIN